MSAAETITSRIHEKADAELNRKIEEVFTAFKQGLNALGATFYHIQVPIRAVDLRDKGLNGLPPGTADWLFCDLDKIISRAETPAKEFARDTFRTKAVDAYMERVDALASEIAELEKHVEELHG